VGFYARGTGANGTGATGEKACAPGTFAAAVGSSSCTSAPAGKFACGSLDQTGASVNGGGISASDISSCTGGYGASEAKECDAGSFTAAAGAKACNYVRPGYYQTAKGQSTEIAAAAGSFSFGTKSVTVNGAAVAGYGSSTIPTKCSPGSYSGAAASSCTAAIAGNYAFGPDTVGGVAGYGATGQTAATAGYFVSGSGASAQTPCAAGSWSAAAAASCTKAAAGNYVATAAASAATPCPASTFCPNTGMTAPYSCTINGSNFTCPAGTTGISNPDCPAGYLKEMV